MPVRRYARSRQLAPIASSSEHKYFWAGATGVQSYPGSYQTLNSHRIIQDVTGTWPLPVGERASPVSDWRFEDTTKDLLPFVGDNNLAVTPIGMRHPFVVSDLKVLLPDDFSGSFWYDQNLEAFLAFTERVPQKISFGEFALGLGELGSLIPKFQASITRTLAGGFLTKKFGWDNLLSDLRAFSTIIADVQQRLRFLKNTRGKPTRIRWEKRDIQFSLPSAAPIVRRVSGARGWDCELKRTYYRCDLGATATLLHRLDHLDDTIGLLRGLTIALGLNNPLKAVWEVMPMSFVVDWFLRISDHLDRVAALQPAEEWHLMDVTRSRKEVAYFQVDQINSEIINGGPNPRQRLGTIRYVSYNRAVGLPLKPEILSVSGLSPDQLVLLLAMLAG